MIKIRRAQYKEDLRDLFIWRNDPVSRASFNDSQEIIWENHSKWFENAINDKTRYFYILYNDKTKLGVVRFDQVDSNKYYVSLNSNPKIRGLGLGSQMLSIATQEFYNKFNAPVVIAEVKINNIASLKSFLRAGYKQINQTSQYYTLQYFLRDGKSSSE